MKKTLMLRTAAALSVALALSCGDSDGLPEAEQAPDTVERGSLRERLASIHSDLTAGSSGSEVEAVHEYLTAFGILPSPDKANGEVDERPADTSVFDGATESAVRAFQKSANLLETGTVDAATRAKLLEPRCGTNAASSRSSSNKWAHVSRLTNTTVTWRVVNTDDAITLAQARTAATNAFAAWRAQTSLTFTQVTSGTADIMINFVDAPDDALAWGDYPHAGSDIRINTDYTWTVANPTPVNQYDLQSLLVHEIGHNIGLDHTDVSAAVMWPWLSDGGNKRNLNGDDITGISAYYDIWTSVAGTARDIGVGPNGQVWAVSNVASGANFQLRRWTGSSWQTSDGVGVRIAVDGFGRPWVVQADGTIFVRSENSVSTGYWQLIVGSARDIAVGADNSVWCLGTDAVAGGWSVWKLNSFLSWDAASGGGTRIAVGPTGVPWVVTSAGAIQRRSTSAAGTAGWTTLPGSGRDIGVGPDGAAWIITNTSGTGGFRLAVWNNQAQILTGTEENTPARNGWVTVNRFGTNVSVGPNSGVWVTDSSNGIWLPQR